MSSISHQIIKSSTDPTASKLKELSDAFILENSLSNPSEGDETNDNLMIVDHSRIKVHDELAWLHTKSTDTEFLGCREPDGVKMTCWFRFLNGGNSLQDFALLGNKGLLYGTPKQEFGLVDDGIAGKNLCMKFDGVKDYVKIPDAANMRMLGQTVGFSIRFIYKSNNNAIARIASKSDDANNGWILVESPDAEELRFLVKKAGTEYKIKFSPLLKNTVYDIVATFDWPTNTPKLYINNTLSTIATTAIHRYNKINFNTFLMSMHGGMDFVNGWIQDFRFEREKVYTSAEVANLFTNKLSTDTIALGNVPIAGHTWPVQGSFTTTSFTADSFKVGASDIFEDLDPFGIRKLFPTKSGGAQWFSTAWNNGNFRIIGAGDFDPNDSQFQYSNGDPDSTEIQISGTGELRHTESNTSARLRVHGTWLNTEITVYQFSPAADTGLSDIQLRSRSRHETACSFGNYLVKFRDTVGYTGTEAEQRNVAVEVEAMHTSLGGYVRRLGEVSLPSGLPKDQWIGFKQITRTIAATGQIKVEGYINYSINNQSPTAWVKMTEYIFTGTNPTVPAGFATDPEVDSCLGSGDGQATKMNNLDPQCFRYTDTGNLCWVRANGPNTTKWKFYSIREINPL